MKATIWHNPRCSKSRETLALLEAAGADVTIIEYLKHPPSSAKLAQLYADAGLAPREGLRKDARISGNEVDILKAMTTDPAIIERPLVETERGVRLARPPERVREIL